LTLGLPDAGVTNPFFIPFDCHFPIIIIIINNNNNNNSFQPQCQLSLKILGHTIIPLTTHLKKEVDQTLGTTISELTFHQIDKEFHLKLEDNMYTPFKITRNGWKNRWKFNILNIVRYTKIRYPDWLFAGGEGSGEKFFIDLWDPKALEAIKDPKKDTHPRAQCLKGWTKTKEKQKEEPPLSLGLDNHYLVSYCSLLCLSFGLYLLSSNT
jgi:hypothetical protein